MSEKSMDYGELVKDAFRVYTKQENLVPLLVGALIVSIGFAFLLLPGFALLPGFVGMAIRVGRGERVEIGDVWAGNDRAIAGVIAGILFCLAMFAGLIALIVGAVFVAFFLSFWPYFVASQSVSAVEALKLSFGFVKENLVHVLVITVIGWVISMVLSMVPFVGGIVAFSFSTLLTASLFNKLTANGVAASPDAAQPTASAF